MDGMVYAALAYSTIPKGRIAALDTSAARGRAGRRAGDDASQRAAHEPATGVPDRAAKRAAATTCRSCRTTRSTGTASRSRWCSPETQEQADHAASLIRATYAAEPAVTVASRRPGRTRTAARQLPGPAAAATRSATPRRRWPRRRTRSTSPTAPRATTTTRSSRTRSTVAWDGDDLIVHDATQGVRTRAWSLAQVFGIQEEQVHVSSPFVGGGFGGKTLWQHQILAAAAAQARRAAGADRAVARGRVPRRRRAHAPPSSAWRSAPRPTGASTR